MHETRPIFSAQFHPEACGGPMDSEVGISSKHKYNLFKFFI